MHHYLLFTLIALLAGSGLIAKSIERRNQYLICILEINIPQRFQETTRRVTVQESTWTDWRPLMVIAPSLDRRNDPSTM